MSYHACHATHDKHKSPLERRYGLKPHRDDFIRFGCKAYVYIDADERLKMRPHAWVGYCVGITSTMNGYLVYRPDNNTIYRCYHVLLDDDAIYGHELGPMRQRDLANKQFADEIYQLDNHDIDTVIHSQHPLHRTIHSVVWHKPQTANTTGSSGLLESTPLNINSTPPTQLAPSDRSTERRRSSRVSSSSSTRRSTRCAMRRSRASG